MTFQRSQSRLITLLVHVLIWSVFALTVFFRQPLLNGIDISYQLWLKQIVTLALLGIAFYVNTLVLVPGLLLRGFSFYYFVIIIVIVAGVVLTNAWIDSLSASSTSDLASKVLRFPRMRRPLGRHINTLTLIISALVLMIGTSITVIQKWQKDKQEREKADKEKLASELLLLKAQINPHFFFNTLNNIYALTQIDGAKAGDAIHKLSHMMRYLLYETQQDQTMLSRELSFLKDYIDLMQLRLTDTVKLTLDVSPQLKDMPMAPMILLPFVENAFKHGISATEQSHIFIGLKQNDGLLEMLVKNSRMNSNSVRLDTNSGIGLPNTRRRLDLLYPGKYKLVIDDLTSSNEYSVQLTIDLT
jgi:two-component system, LytTR family, sensor kinase